MQVLDHRIEIEALEFLRIAERVAHRAGQGGRVVESLKVQPVRPPVTVRVCVGPARERALAFICHGSLRSCSACSCFVYLKPRLLRTRWSSSRGLAASKVRNRTLRFAHLLTRRRHS